MNSINIVIEVKAVEIAEAISQLAAAFTDRHIISTDKIVFDMVAKKKEAVNEQQGSPIQTPVQPEQPTPIPTATPTQEPYATPNTSPVYNQLAQPQQPVQTQQPVTPQATVPTTEQTYSMEQLAVAATQLMDAGRKQDVINLLATFGVQALTMLPKEHYGNFATQLRVLGAKI